MWYPIAGVKWTGAGCLVGPLMLLGLAVGVIAQHFFDGHRWVTDSCWIAGFVVSAILIRIVGRRLNRYANLHTLYDTPMQTYSWLAVACAVLTLVIVLLFRLAPGSS